jgi:hypothetical protein
MVDRAAPRGRLRLVERRHGAAARGEVKLGMTKDEVRTAMGKPNRTGKTIYRGRAATYWAYLYTDVYFDEDGLVAGWQTALG